MRFLVKPGGDRPLPAITVDADSPEEALEAVEQQSGVKLDRRQAEIHDATTGVVYRLQGDDDGGSDDDGPPGEGEVS